MKHPGTAWTNADTFEIRRALAPRNPRPPASPEDVAAVEAQLRLPLPDDYRRYLLEVSDGGTDDGAWPLYGTARLAQLCDPMTRDPGDCDAEGEYAPPSLPVDLPGGRHDTLEVAGLGCDATLHLALQHADRGTLWKLDLAARPMWSRVADIVAPRLSCDVRSYLRLSLGLDPPWSYDPPAAPPARDADRARAVTAALDLLRDRLRVFGMRPPTRYALCASLGASQEPVAAFPPLVRLANALHAYAVNIPWPRAQLGSTDHASRLAHFRSTVSGAAVAWRFLGEAGAAVARRSPMPPVLVRDLPSPFEPLAALGALGALPSGDAAQWLVRLVD